MEKQPIDEIVNIKNIYFHKYRTPTRMALTQSSIVEMGSWLHTRHKAYCNNTLYQAFFVMATQQRLGNCSTHLK